MSISQRSLKAIGVSETISNRWIEELQATHRHYHTLAHISHILTHYSEIGGTDTAILAAAWLHDIRYDVLRSDNEDVSAEIAREDLRGTNVDIPLVVDIILDTKKHEGGSPVLDLFSDLDLLIFGTNRGVYEHYMRGIRREYGFAPLDQYATVRAGILRTFDEKQIFQTAHFSDREKTAHDNLKYEISVLENNPSFIEVG